MAKKKKADPPAKIRIRKDDSVKVITGRDAGKTGRVISVDRRTGRIIVEGVMLAKHHTRPNPAKQTWRMRWRETRSAVCPATRKSRMPGRNCASPTSPRSRGRCVSAYTCQPTARDCISEETVTRKRAVM